MSNVTTAILWPGGELHTPGYLDPAEIQALNLRVAQWGHFAPLADAFGGWKNGATVYGAAFNHLDVAALFQAVLLIDWPKAAEPGWTSDRPSHWLQIWLKGENDVQFITYTIADIRAYLAPPVANPFLTWELRRTSDDVLLRQWLTHPASTPLDRTAGEGEYWRVLDSTGVERWRQGQPWPNELSEGM